MTPDQANGPLSSAPDHAMVCDSEALGPAGRRHYDCTVGPDGYFGPAGPGPARGAGAVPVGGDDAGGGRQRHHGHTPRAARPGARLRAPVCAFMCVHACVRIYVCVRVCACMCACLCMRARLFVCVCARTCACAHASVCARVRLCALSSACACGHRARSCACARVWMPARG
jgi:hypothetical protein